MDDRPELLALLHDLITGLGAPALTKAAEPWPRALEPAAHDPHPLPVTAYLSAEDAPPLARPVLNWLAAHHAELAWRQTYDASDFGAAFLDRYGWCELIGPFGLYHADDLRIGILMLGPHTTYPAHAHEAAEIYVPLSGTAHWYRGDRGWKPRAPLSVIEHAPWVEHGTATQDAPLVTLYLWRGQGLRAKSTIT